MHSKTGIDVSAGLAELIEMEAPLAPFMATMLHIRTGRGGGDNASALVLEGFVKLITVSSVRTYALRFFPPRLTATQLPPARS